MVTMATDESETGIRGAAARAALDAEAGRECARARLTLREQKYAAQEGKCWICEKHMRLDVDSNHPEYATFDHVHALALGGTEQDHNLKLAHKLCNNRRGTGKKPVYEHAAPGGRPMPFTSAWLRERGYMAPLPVKASEP